MKRILDDISSSHKFTKGLLLLAKSEASSFGVHIEASPAVLNLVETYHQLQAGIAAIILLVNPQRACARILLFVCLSVCFAVSLSGCLFVSVADLEDSGLIERDTT